MSLFNEDTSATTQENTTNEANQGFLDLLVKTKGESFKDVEVLAKSKLEADNYIEQLKAQLKEQEYMENLKKEILEKASGTAQTPAAVTTDPKENTSPKVDDIESLIEQKLAKRQAEDIAKTNLKQVEEALNQTYGQEAKTVLDRKAAELGMTKERMAQIASESPAAFLKLVEAKAVDVTSSVRSTVNTQALGQNTGVKNFKYFEELRKKNPKLANDPTYYSEMFQARKALGNDFYK